MSLKYLFIDFDSFFASVEQQNNPNLRNKPIGIVPSLGVLTTCCIAASYEAKHYGIKTGTSVKEAMARCEDILFVEAGHSSYIKTHKRMMDVIESCIHIEHILSIDECYGVIPKYWNKDDILLEKCKEIKKKLKEQVGAFITCSIGVGPNRFLAKIASKMRKPNGVQIIRNDDLPEVLYGMDLNDLHGIGRGMNKRLKMRGINSVKQLCQLSRERMSRAWGSKIGDIMWKQLRGMEVPEVETTRRSISHSHVLPPQLRNRSSAKSVLHKQLQKACRRLRSMGYFSSSLMVYVKFGYDYRWKQEARFYPTQDTLTMAHYVNDFWDKAPREEMPTKVAIVLSGLIPEHLHTPSLFEQDNQSRRVRGQCAMDQLNQCYGNKMLFYASAYEAYDKKSAPMRISFNHIPDENLESD